MGTTKRLAWTCRVESDVPAPVEAVWRVVSDVTRTGVWSHECLDVEWLDGATAPTPGARFRGGNKSLWWRWHRTCEVTDIEPGRSVAWRTIPTWRYVDSTDWRITLEPLGGARTRIVQTFQVTRCPLWWEWVVAYANPPHRDRSAALAADLRRIGEVAAADVSTAGSTDTPAP
jgi:hypothetical protein